jgi:hypothetical protein
MPENKRPATEKDIMCPKCGGTEDIHFGEYVFRRIPLDRIDDGVLMFATSGDTVCWEANKDEALFCGICCEDFPIPDDVEINFE